MNIADTLTHRVVIVNVKHQRIEVPCDSDGHLVIAMLPAYDGLAPLLSITHRPTGWSADAGARFPATPEGLAAAQGFRDEMLALPMSWGGERVELLDASCFDALRAIHIRAAQWEPESEEAKP